MQTGEYHTVVCPGLRPLTLDKWCSLSDPVFPACAQRVVMKGEVGAWTWLGSV